MEPVLPNPLLAAWLEENRPARVLVSGSVHWCDGVMVDGLLTACRTTAAVDGGFFRILTGMAAGADQIARAWAAANGVDLFAEPLSHQVPLTGQVGASDGPAEWDDVARYNRELLRLQPSIVLAFKQGLDDAWSDQACMRGTEHMCRIAARSGVPVLLNGERWLASAH